MSGCLAKASCAAAASGSRSLRGVLGLPRSATVAFSSSLAAAAAVGGGCVILVDFSAWVLAATMVFRPLGRWCDLTGPLVGAASWATLLAPKAFCPESFSLPVPRTSLPTAVTAPELAS